METNQHGGSRPNAGRKTKPEIKLPHSVRIYKKDHDKIVKRDGSLQRFLDGCIFEHITKVHR